MLVSIVLISLSSGRQKAKDAKLLTIASSAQRAAQMCINDMEGLSDGSAGTNICVGHSDTWPDVVANIDAAATQFNVVSYNTADGTFEFNLQNGSGEDIVCTHIGCAKAGSSEGGSVATASAADDFFITDSCGVSSTDICSGTVTFNGSATIDCGGFALTYCAEDVSLNDIECSDGVTTYEPVQHVFGPGFGVIVGMSSNGESLIDPDLFPQDYNILCDGVVIDTATVTSSTGLVMP